MMRIVIATMLVASVLEFVLFVFCSNAAAANPTIRRLRRQKALPSTPRALQKMQYMREPCLTKESCRERFDALYDAGAITGYFYNIINPNPNTSSKGCILKGENAYFASGTVEEMTATLTGTKVRLWCINVVKVPL
jgi:hypothetical protein